MFGGDRLKQKYDPTLADVQDPELFSRNVRFAPSVGKNADGSRNDYQVNDMWVYSLVDAASDGSIASWFDGKSSQKDILLLPLVLNSSEYTPPADEDEVPAMCYLQPPYVAPQSSGGSTRSKASTKKH